MDDREQDKIFERLVARTLRKNLQPGGEACPDAEILAAYAEHALSASENAHWEAHFSACSPCQRTLTALARSISVPAEANEAEFVPAAESSATPAAAAPAPARPVEAHLEKVVSVPRRTPIWTWLVPALAAASVAVLWIALRPASQRPVEIASRPAAPPVGAQTAQEAPKEEEQHKPPAAPESASKDNAPAEVSSPRLLGSSVGKLPAPSRIAQAENAARMDRREGALQGKAPADAPIVRRGRANVAPGGVSESKEKMDQERGAVAMKAIKPEPQQAEAAKEEVAGLAGQPGAAGREAQDKTAALTARRAAVPSPAPPSLERKEQDPFQKASSARDAEASSRLGMKATVAPLVTLSPAGARRDVIVSPRPVLMWRVGAGGKIERSRDRGQTWEQQPSNVTADLVAGSAPSDTVCWVVGAAGTILRTTDGEHWEKITPPTPLDWTSVSARDALHATITADHATFFITRDGGRTWQVLPKKR